MVAPSQARYAFFFAICLALTAVGGGAVRAGESIYDLNISFDVERSMLTGAATIDVPQNIDLEIHRAEGTRAAS